jgi:hypothetical protein
MKNSVAVFGFEIFSKRCAVLCQDGIISDFSKNMFSSVINNRDRSRNVTSLVQFHKVPDKKKLFYIS